MAPWRPSVLPCSASPSSSVHSGGDGVRSPKRIPSAPAAVPPPEVPRLVEVPRGESSVVEAAAEVADRAPAKHPPTEPATAGG